MLDRVDQKCEEYKNEKEIQEKEIEIKDHNLRIMKEQVNIYEDFIHNMVQ